MDDFKDHLETYLRGCWPAWQDLRVVGLKRIPGGMSRETWSIDVVRTEAGRTVEHGLVVRRDPPVGMIATNRELEFGVLKALAGTDVPVPQGYALEPTGEVLGRPFFVMERVPGSSSLSAISDRAARVRLLLKFVDCIGRLHALDCTRLDLPVLAKPADVRQATLWQVEEWAGVWNEARLEPNPLLERMLVWLRRNVPTRVDRVVLIHSDPRPGNFLFVDEEITGIVDWEMAHFGDPMEDVAWLLDNLSPSLHEPVLRQYQLASGIPVDAEHLRYQQAFINYKRAVVSHTGGRPFVEGTDQNLFLALVATALYTRLQAEIAKQLGLIPTP